MRVLILGAKGMAGHMIDSYLRASTDWEVISLGREEFEVADDQKWEEKIKEINCEKKIDYIINCIGVLKPVVNKDPVIGMKINSVFPHELAKLSTSINTKVIHLSSDCWADLDFYGRSKRAGEIDYADHLTIRTSIIGPELKSNGNGLFHWFMSQNGETNGFVNHYWDGVTTLELAKQIKLIIKDKPESNHIVDLRTKSKVNKFELVNYIKSSFKKKIKINEKSTEIVDKTNSNPDIVCDKSLKDQVEELAEWSEKNLELYKQYF